MECASTPNPRYGCRFQYFRLCRESRSPIPCVTGRAKFEISYCCAPPPASRSQAALEETFFLGLRMNRGVSLSEIVRQFGTEAMQRFEPVFVDLIDAALLAVDGDRVSLTTRGRLLSNEVFARFLRDEPSVRM